MAGSRCGRGKLRPLMQSDLLALLDGVITRRLGSAMEEMNNTLTDSLPLKTMQPQDFPREKISPL